MVIARRSCVGLVTAVGAVVALAIGAPGASAAGVRYASPTGTGYLCSSTEPCDIAQAVNNAGSGDEVIVRPGLYGLAATLTVPSHVTIHGVAGQPRPVVMFTSLAGVKLQSYSSLRYMEIVEAEPTMIALVGQNATVDQVVVKGSSAADCAVALYNSTMVNSIVVARTTDGNAICSGAFQGTNLSSYRNVTAIAQNGAAIDADAYSPGANVILDVVNVIAKAGPGGAGLSASTESAGAYSTILVNNTNYLKSWTYGAGATVTVGSGNQGTPPTFVNEAAGDYRQKAGSVTIDAGVKDALNGTLDVDGDPRNVGAPDIGADEFVVAPTASTNPASAVTATGATLAGSVNPKGAPTSYHFEYGTTTAYGASTAATAAGSGLGGVPASAAVSGLVPATTYHYRVVASNAAGVAHGGDQTFTTAPAVTPGTPGTSGSATSSAGSFAGVKLVSTRLVFARRAIAVKLSCPASTAGRCTGRTKLTVRHRRPGSRTAATVTLGTARFSIAPGQQARVKVRVTRAGRRLFASTRRLRGRAASAAHDGAGLSKTTVAAVRIRKGTG